MRRWNLSHYVISSCVATSLLAGCVLRQAQDDVQLPVGAPDAIAQRIRSASSSYQVLYSFSGRPDGQSPLASLVDVKGVLYGTTSRGGKYGYADDKGGTVFSITTSGTEHVLYSFRKGQPFASLIDVGDILYGTTQYGGGGRYGGAGTIFSISTSGKERQLYSFQFAYHDGHRPMASLVNARGPLYGTTSQGGATTDSGTVFTITTGGTENILHSFGGRLDGDYPEAALIDVNGTFYGTTYAGGGSSRCGSSPGCASGPSSGCFNGCGTVFSVTKGGTEKVLHSFSFGSGDGSLPESSLIDVHGTLYGTTFWGGPGGELGGTVFSITTSGTEKILHDFHGPSDGVLPHGSLIDVNGTLYGTTEEGGAYGDGTVFSISPYGVEEKVLHSFGSGSDGAYPFGGLIDVNGTLYGTTAGGGTHTGCFYGGCGTVFALSL
ncbi:MAG: choice-of-anchor tandem repeat GloVer-containing protein [Candidatus Cybelea sp.]